MNKYKVHGEAAYKIRNIRFIFEASRRDANAGNMGSIPGPGEDPIGCRATKPVHGNY